MAAKQTGSAGASSDAGSCFCWYSEQIIISFPNGSGWLVLEKTISPSISNYCKVKSREVKYIRSKTIWINGFIAKTLLHS